MLNLSEVRLCVIGLGYVGLPLAVEFGKHYPTIGFDINNVRIAELKRGEDHTLEVDEAELAEVKQLMFTNQLEDIKNCNTYIVTVPSPVDKHNRPDLMPLIKASETVGKVVSKGDVVIYESTVYPGATEEECIPIVERVSGLTFNTDFFVGYSPERINPGDKLHRFTTIKKVTSGSTPDSADYVDALYASVVVAGTYKVCSIKVAEAAKVIENTQRDLNIALVNEFAIIFNRIGIDTEAVLEAAGTKWNFLPFRPGLVGGHCIGVDPYYLTQKAQELGYYPEIILAGRRINDGMGAYVAERVLRLMTVNRIQVVDSRVLVLGLTFKENCPDMRNSKVIDIISELQTFNVGVDVYDPWVDAGDALREYGIEPIQSPQLGTYDAVILAVAHQQFKEMGIAGIRTLAKSEHVIFDVKCLFDANTVDGRL